MRRWMLLAFAILGAILIGASVVLVLLGPRLQEEALDFLSQRTGVQVQLEEFGLSFWPPLQLRGGALKVGTEEQTDRLYLTTDAFRVEARAWELWQKPRRVRRIRVDGVKAILPARHRAAVPGSEPAAIDSERSPSARIDRIEARNLEIQIRSSQEGKEPRIFAIHDVLVTRFSLDQPFPFQASLTYPRPRGELEVSGTLGPWSRDRALETPVSGDYLLVDADMGNFNGIRGLLTTSGSFEGNLEQTRITGSADIPDFEVVKSGNVVPLKVVYKAERIGGDVLLREVRTDFGDSELLSVGSVATPPEGQNRVVTLHVSTGRARVEDLIRFGLEGHQAPLEGDIRLETDVTIPLGPAPFLDRLSAGGDFVIENGVFTNLDVQKTLARISQIGTGAADGESGSTPVSDFEGTFALREGKIHFSRLTFGIPGTQLDLKGSYGLKDQSLDFQGEVLMQRSPSEMVPASWARWVKVVDPLLRRGRAGTVVPIRITGSRSKPKFAPDF